MAYSQYPRNLIRLRFHNQYEHGIGRAFEHKQKGFRRTFLLEPTVRLGMSQQGLTMLVVWDGFDHELIPLFLNVLSNTFILENFEVRSTVLDGLGLAKLRLKGG